MNPSVKLKKSDLPKAWLKAFPEYKGRKFSVEIAQDVYLSDLHWGGGSRNYYSAVSLETGKAFPALVGSPFSGPVLEGSKVPLNASYVVAEHSIFQGHDMGITFYVHPEAMNQRTALVPVQARLLAAR